MLSGKATTAPVRSRRSKLAMLCLVAQCRSGALAPAGHNDAAVVRLRLALAALLCCVFVQHPAGCSSCRQLKPALDLAMSIFSLLPLLARTVARVMYMPCRIEHCSRL